MSEFEQRKDLRWRFLRAAYDLSPGRQERLVGLYEIAERLGMNFRNDDDLGRLLDMANYWGDKGLIQQKMDNYATFSVTVEAIDEVENNEPLRSPLEDLLQGSLTWSSPPVATNESSRGMVIEEPPVEVSDSLRRFKEDYPNPEKVAFIMMEFGTTKGHYFIVDAVKKALNENEIVGVRADDKRYHDDLYYNVVTYLHGCGLALAVFERLEANVTNPNIALEVGYLLAMGKPVCLLKDQTLETLQSDLVGKLYDPFDPQDPDQTIPPLVSRWLRDKGLVQYTTT